jgi:RNA-directed DNA polymerase
MAEAMSAVVARACGIPESSAKHIASSAANRYKVFYITKRGGKGLREVAQPAREVKAVQRIIIRIVEPMLTIHPAAMAYVAGKSIISNAAAHASAKYLLKLDFSSFFPSIDVLSVSRVVERR